MIGCDRLAVIDWLDVDTPHEAICNDSSQLNNLSSWSDTTPL